MRAAFDRFVFDSERRELLREGTPLHIGPKAFRLLEVLIVAAPRAVAKRELMDAVWEGTFVEESNLAGLVAEIRAALGDSRKGSAFIRTVHGFGYAFTAAVGGNAPTAARLTFAGEDHPLRVGANILGRDASADVTVDDPTVSRRHARLEITADGTATLHDLKSKNGTFLGGERITASMPLRDGDVVVLGDVRLVFRTAGGSTTITRARVRPVRTAPR